MVNVCRATIRLRDDVVPLAVIDGTAAGQGSVPSADFVARVTPPALLTPSDHPIASNFWISVASFLPRGRLEIGLDQEARDVDSAGSDTSAPLTARLAP